MASEGRVVDTWWRLNGCVEPNFFNATQSLTTTYRSNEKVRFMVQFSY